MADKDPIIRIILVEFRFTKNGPIARVTVETKYGGHLDKRDIFISMHSKVVLDFNKRPVEIVEEL